MTYKNLSRRSFLTLSGVAVAGFGLVGCNNGGTANDGNKVSGDAEPLEGSPATTALDKLPLPEKGQVYINAKKRDEIKDGGTLTLPITEIGPDWNYLNVAGNTVYMHDLWNYYMPALCVLGDATGSKIEPNPDFIKSIKVDESTGKQIITVEYAEKAVFNDGTPMDWQAFNAVYTVMSGKNADYTPSATDGYDKIESVAKGDTDKIAVVTMTEPVYPAEALFGVALHPSAVDVDTFNNGWANNPHAEWGAGPFTIDSFNDTQVTFKQNPNWWGDKPKLDTIVFKQMEAQALFNAFKNGEIDTTGATQSGSAEMLSNFNSMEDAQIRRAYGKSVYNIEINSTRGALTDINVRKAFCQSIDPSVIVSIVFQGVNWQEEAPGSMLLQTWSDGYENNLPSDVKDLKDSAAHTAAAKKTLEDAGYALGSDGIYAKDGTRAAFAFTTFGDSATTKNRAAAVQKMAKDAGIEVTIDNHPSSEFSKVLVSGDWDTCLFGWSGTATSIWNGGQFYGSESESNFAKCGNAEIDAEFAKVPSISDHDKQVKASNDAEKKSMATYGYLPVYSGPEVIVTKKGIANVGPCLYLDIRTEDIGWEK